MKKGKKGGHTGKIVHGGPMYHGSKGVGGKDPHADKAHHAANSAQGMSEGCGPADYDGDGHGEGLTGGNCADEC